jgi:predicted Zn-dependent protease
MWRTPLLLLACFSVAEAENSTNWNANSPPCDQHSELLKHGHMDLGVRVATTNALLAEQFRRAINSWARIVDLDWHEDNTQNCSIQLIDGERELFQPAYMVARSQLPDRFNFQGSIAFNRSQSLTAAELYRISVHEIGHVLGLQHSLSAMSVMYALEVDGLEWLDPADLTVLAKHHKLRIAVLDKPVAIGSRP